MHRPRHTPVRAALLACALALAFTPAHARRQTGAPTATSAEARGGPQEIVHEGIRVEFTLEPPAGKSAVLAGEEATVRFRVTDTATKAPLEGSRPSAWMTLREGEAPDAARCREKAQLYLQGSLRARPDVDLNAYYILALNQEPNLSVIDPLLGFGGSKLVTLVFLKSPGADWALTPDRKQLFVSMPEADQVAVVDTTTWKVISNLDAGARPVRLSLRPDGKQLWVGNDPDGVNLQGGVTVFDTSTLKIAASIPTGAGAHEIAFDEENRFAFVANGAAGTLSVVDIPKLSKLKDVKTGARPVAVAYSSLARAAYVASEGGQVTVVDGRTHNASANVALKPGLKSLRFAPGGRYGFAPNAAESVVHVFDASTNRPAHDIAVGKGADRVSFTGAYAYVRSAGAGEVFMIRLNTLGKQPDVSKFPGGQQAPNASPDFNAAPDAIVPAPEGNAVLVANAADKMIYYYSEGMAAPMGSFQNYKRLPRAVTVVDRSLREGSPGVYATNVRLPKSGRYDVTFLLDSPRLVHCFQAEAAPNPALKEGPKVALGIEYLNEARTVRVNEPFKLRFKLTDAATGQPKDGLTDVRVLFFLSPGVWQKRDLAQGSGGGVYELTLTPPRDGVYMVFVESQSQGVTFRQLKHLTLQASAEPAGKTP